MSSAATLPARAAGSLLRPLAAYLRMERPPGTLPALDGLRAIAIGLVLLRHAVRPFHPEIAPLLPIGAWDLATPMRNGWMGVDLFFVLSGFLITHHVCARYAGRLDRRGIGDYVRRRLFRIVPAYYAVLLLAVAGAFPHFVVAPDRLGTRVGYHLLFMQDYLPSDIVVVFWSLGVEEKFYLLAPLLIAGLLACRTPGRRYAALAALALTPTMLRALAWRTSPAGLDYESFFLLFRSPFHASFDGLIVGTACALLYRDRERLRRLTDARTVHALFGGGAGLLGVLLFATPLLATIDAFDAVLLQAVLGLAMGAVLLAVALGGGPGTLLSHRSLFVVSKLAYALYLTHYAVIPGVETWLAGMLDPATPRALRFACFLPIYLGASFGAATLLHYLIEKPFLLLRDRRRAFA